MSEIKLHIEDRYLQAFLDFLKTVSYVSVREVSGEGQKANGAMGLQKPQASHLTPYAEPLKDKTDLAEILREQGYDGPDKQRFEQFVKGLDIQEPVEELISQLTK